jgi:hypothetical protein
MLTTAARKATSALVSNTELECSSDTTSRRARNATA